MGGPATAGSAQSSPSTRPAAPGRGPSSRIYSSSSATRTASQRPEVNTVLHGHEVDLLWREAGLAVELDGRAAHATRRAFEQDRVRDAELTVAGQRVVRITARRLDTAPKEVMAQIRSLSRP